MEVTNGKSLTVFWIWICRLTAFLGGCYVEFFYQKWQQSITVSVSIKVATPLMLSLIIQRKSPPVKLAKISYKHQTLLLHQTIYF